LAGNKNIVSEWSMLV